MLLEFGKSGHPIFRATTPLSRGKLKSKRKGKVSIHFSAEPDTIDTIYCIILSANQLNIYGAVATICEEYEGQPDNTGEPVILEGQSIVLGEVKAEAPAPEESEVSNILLQKYFQQDIVLCCLFCHKMSLNIDKKRILPVKVSGDCPIELRNR